jgi:hypothetical protein
MGLLDHEIGLAFKLGKQAASPVGLAVLTVE